MIPFNGEEGGEKNGESLTTKRISRDYIIIRRRKYLRIWINEIRKKKR